MLMLMNDATIMLAMLMPRYNGNIMPKYICTGTRVMNKIFMSVFEGKMLALHICIKK